jgi:hypothetical protein
MNIKFLRICFLKMSNYNKDLLLEILNNKNAKLIGEYPKLSSLTKIIFKCNCGKETIRQFLWLNHGKGALCKKCSLDDRSENTKKITQQNRLKYLNETLKNNGSSIIGIYKILTIIH